MASLTGACSAATTASNVQRAYALATLLALAVLPGCSTTRVYSPTAAIAVEDALRIVTRALEEQPHGFAVSNARVTPEKLSFERQHGSLVFGGSRPVPTTFYFDSLGKMDVTSKRTGDVVRVWDRAGAFRFRVLIPETARAQQFMDAMTSLGATAGARPR
jgi:hypothetical protein